MSLSQFPLPSIHHVLEAELHETLQRRPSIITVLEHEQLDLSPATTQLSTLPTVDIGHIPSTSHLMKTIHLRDAEPIAKDDEEQFSFIVHFPDYGELENHADVYSDAQTIFEEMGPSTSQELHRHPLRSSAAKHSFKHRLSLLVISTIRKVLPVKISAVVMRRMDRQ